MIKSGEPPGNVVRLVEGGRYRTDETDVLDHRPDRRQQHGRLEGVPRCGGGIRGQRWTVGQEERIERAAFGNPGDVAVVVDVDEPEGIVLDTPSRFVLSGIQDVGVEMQLPRS